MYQLAIAYLNFNMIKNWHLCKDNLDKKDLLNVLDSGNLKQLQYSKIDNLTILVKIFKKLINLQVNF